MFFFIAVKNCTKAYHNIYSLYKSTHLKPTQSNFLFYDFSAIYYDFQKYSRSNLTVLKSSGGDMYHFIG
jgi:hypothetical protein